MAQLTPAPADQGLTAVTHDIAVMGLVAFLVVLGLLPMEQLGPLRFVLAGAIVVLTVVVSLVLTIPASRFRRRITEAGVEGPLVVTPGEGIRVTATQTVQGPARIDGITISLLMHEWNKNTASSGVMYANRDHMVAQHKAQGRQIRRGKQFVQEQARFTVPPDAMHTWMAPDPEAEEPSGAFMAAAHAAGIVEMTANHLSWRVRVRIEGPLWLFFERDYLLTVAPPQYTEEA